MKRLQHIVSGGLLTVGGIFLVVHEGSQYMEHVQAKEEALLGQVAVGQTSIASAEQKLQDDRMKEGALALLGGIMTGGGAFEAGIALEEKRPSAETQIKEATEIA